MIKDYGGSIADEIDSQWVVYTMRPCSSLDCAGEYRPMQQYDDGAWECLACRVIFDPSEASYAED